MSHYQKLKCMLLLLVAAVSANAQIESGKVYNIANVGQSGRSLAVISNTDAGTVPTNTADYSQLWYASKKSDNSYSFRNLQSGRYLHSSNAASTQWTLVKNIGENCKFEFKSIGSGYAIRATNTTDNYHYMHSDASYNVVGWESSSTSSQWTVKVVDISADVLEKNWAELETVDPSDTNIAIYKSSLENLFTDNACTTLKKNFASEAAVKADADYLKLPATLQEMVLKVYNNNWSESNFDSDKSGWDSQYAKKYRVQLYEPYNEPEEAAKALTLNAHTNLNNPTGIFTSGRQPLYVMVEGTIEDGATLYLDSYTGHGKAGAYNKGVELKEGLNIIPTYTTGMNYFINYVVKTFDTSDGKRGNKAKKRSLSGYPDLKIHIEGGYINGYYNKVGDDLYGAGDKNDDWKYIEARATQTDVTVLGKYITLQFPLNDADTEGNKGLGYYFNEQVNIEEAIDEWDKVMIWERLLLGVVDEATIDKYDKVSPYSNKKVFEYTGNDSDFATGYANYYNVHGLSFGVGGSSYMYGSWDHCGYHYNTMEGVIQNLPKNAGSHWGPAHEIGHQHQGIINMRGETEVTNNLFSNMVLWYFGETTSRVNGTEGSLSNVLANFNNTNGHYLTNSIWGMTQMYYKLFLYYHVLGHNTKFYPRLFEMLRQDPLDARGVNVDGAKAHLHLYKKMCQASGEDLTEFFRAHGFFKPLSNYSIDDYGISTYNMTQEQIDAAIAEVKELRYKENIAVLFINDATGETIKSHKDDYYLALYGETTICAETGCYATFNDNTTPSYTYTISGKTIKMSGNGGVGFAVFNNKNEIIAFSDNKTFTVSNGCATAISSGNATVKAVQADKSLITVPNIMDTNNDEAKRTALGELVEAARTTLALTDNTGTKVGYYWPASTSTLQELYNAAKEVYDESDVVSYASVYHNLLQGMNELQNNKNAHVGFMEGNAYRLTNKGYSSLSMSINNSELIGEATNDTDRQKWYFEPAETDGRYYLKNKETQTYPGDVATSKMPAINATSPADAYAYELVDMGNGLWALVGSTGLHCDQYRKIVGWDINDPHSQWYITAVELSEDIAKNLQDLIDETEELIGQTGSITPSGSSKVVLTEENFYTNAPYTSERNSDYFTSYSVLCDNNPETYLHTDYSNSTPNEDHYIRIDLGSGNKVSKFNLHYRTRYSGNLCAPTKAAIEASNDADTWTTLREVTSGLPETPNTEYTFENLGNGNAYRYIRMRVYRSNATDVKYGRYYFVVSEMGISTVAVYNATLNETYSSIESNILLEAYKAMVAAQETLEAGQPLEYANALRALTEKHNALVAARKAVENANTEAVKRELAALASATAAMVDNCGTIVYTPETVDGVLPLQADNANASYYVSSNADQNTGGGTPDGEGIKALVDGKMDTFFHTRYGGEVVNAPHYIQIDLGEDNAIDGFKFSYKPRDPSPAPEAITVYGSNDGKTFTDAITSITSGLPAYNSNKTYTSQKIETTTAYRYLRFTVTKSKGPGTEQYGGQYFFGMLEFNLTATGHPESYSIAWKDAAGGVTEDLLLSAYSLCKEAEAICQQETTKDEILEAIEKLEEKKQALEEAMKITYPVKFTQDHNAPKLYKIKDRNGNLLQYDETTGMSSLQPAGTSDVAEQAFYFVRDNQNAQVYIYPYMADGKLLAANDITDGDSKVIAMDKGTATYEQWSFIKRTGQNYNLQPSDTEAFLSCNGNAGFNRDSNDASLFAFTSSSVKGCPAYHRLKSYHSNVKKVYGTSISGGNAPGYYPTDKAEAYNNAYKDATTALNSTDTDEQTCRAAHQALEKAVENLKIIMPEEGRFYRITNYVTKNGTLYVGASNRLSYKKTAISDASDIFQFVNAEGGYYLYNVARGTYLSVAEDNGKQNVSNATSTDNAKKITIASFNNGTTPQVLFATEEEAKIQAGKNGAVICGSDAASGTEAAWYITEVEANVIKHVLSVPATGWETLTLAFNAEIPADVTAYKVTGIIDGNAIIKAISGVLPANTPVLIKAEKGTYEFAYTAADAVIGDNILDGKPYNTTISTDNGFANYMLDTNNGIAGLYLQTGDVTDGTISIEANKAYLAVPNDGNATPSFLYITENYEEDNEDDEENGDDDETGDEGGDEESGDDNETGDEEGDEENGDDNETGDEEGDEENGDDNETGKDDDEEDDEFTGISETKSETKKQIIYDLSGNRVEKMEKGVYIVNGKKVVVK